MEGLKEFYIIDNRTYYTETSEVLFEYPQPFGPNVIVLITAKGNYWQATKNYAHALTANQLKELMLEKHEYDLYVQEFGPLEEA